MHRFFEVVYTSAFDHSVFATNKTNDVCLCLRTERQEAANKTESMGHKILQEHSISTSEDCGTTSGEDCKEDWSASKPGL